MIPHVLHPSVAVFAAASLLTFPTRMMADSPDILKIAVTRGGEVTANGKRTTLEDLDAICRGLAEHKGRSLVLSRGTQRGAASNCAKSAGDRHPSQFPCPTFQQAGLF
jgi:hypothetical protein